MIKIFLNTSNKFNGINTTAWVLKGLFNKNNSKESNTSKKAVATDLFGICRGEIETRGDIISPLEVEWKAMK